MQLTQNDKKKYLLPEKQDFEILAKCKELEKKKLSKQDREMVRFIKTQLEKDWRKHLIKKLNQLLNKY